MHHDFLFTGGQLEPPKRWQLQLLQAITVKTEKKGFSFSVCPWDFSPMAHLIANCSLASFTWQCLLIASEIFQRSWITSPKSNSYSPNPKCLRFASCFRHPESMYNLESQDVRTHHEAPFSTAFWEHPHTLMLQRLRVSL